MLSGKVLSELQLEEGSEVEVHLVDGAIRITPVVEKHTANAELSSWDAQFKAAIEAGKKRENLSIG